MLTTIHTPHAYAIPLCVYFKGREFFILAPLFSLIKQFRMAITMGNLDKDDREYMELLMENQILKFGEVVDNKIRVKIENHKSSCPNNPDNIKKPKKKSPINKITLTVPERIIKNPWTYIILTALLIISVVVGNAQGVI